MNTRRIKKNKDFLPYENDKKNFKRKMKIIKKTKNEKYKKEKELREERKQERKNKKHS